MPGKSFADEMNEYLNPMMVKIREIPIQKLDISCWKGKLDDLDNVSGVSVRNERGHLISQVTLVQLDCHNDYVLLAEAIAEKMELGLKTDGFDVIKRSSF